MPTYAIDFQSLARRIEMASLELMIDGQPGPEAHLQEHNEALLAEASTKRGALDLAIHHWIHHGSFPTLTQRDKRLLYFRFLAAFRFLDLLSLSEDSAPVFRVDGMKDDSFLCWVLCEWGHHHGTIQGLSEFQYSWLLRKFHGLNDA